MELNHLLAHKGIPADTTLVMRHQPHEERLRRVFSWIADSRPDLFNAYQGSQTPRVESAMSRASHVAAFIASGSGAALFVGLFRIRDSRWVGYDEYWSIPENSELRERGMAGPKDPARRMQLFALEHDTAFYPDWKGRLLVDWPGARSWWRWAANASLPVRAIHQDNMLSPPMPRWQDLVLTWQELQSLPTHWAVRLAEWRGIYYIVDEADGRGYVGSAYGAANLLGRWRGYASSGHGGNAQLRGRAPDSFKFSILQRLDPDMDAREVVEFEGTWKSRLGTRVHGLNSN